MWLTPNGFGWPDAYSGPRNWIEANPYVGAATLLLAAWGLVGIRRQEAGGRRQELIRSVSPKHPFFWAVMAVVSASMAYGAPPLNMLNELPGFSTSFNWRLISVTGFCLIVLAGMGLDRLLRFEGRVVPRWWAGVAVAFGLVGAGFAVVGVRVWTVSSRDAAAYTGAWKAWAAALFCVGALLILARLLGWLRPGAFGLLVIGLITLDMVRAAWGFNPTLPKETFYPPHVLLTFAAERGPTERLAVVGRHLESNILTAYRVPAYSLYDATMDNRFMAFTRLLSPETFRRAFREGDPGLTTHLMLIEPSAALLSAVGIKWVLTDGEDPNGWQPTPSNGPIYRKTLTKNHFTIWENLYARPYTYFATNYHVNPGKGEAADDEVVKRMQSLAPDTVNVVQVEDPEGAFPPDVGRADLEALPPRGESVVLESYAPGEIRVRARADRPRFLVVSESWASGWRATLDGQPAPIYRANYVIQGVVVPAGEHEVRLVYDPPAFRWGVAVSVVAIAAWFGLAGWAVKRETRNAKRDA